MESSEQIIQIERQTMSTLITGGTGFVGSELLKLVGDGFLTTRSPGRLDTSLTRALTPIGWDPMSGPLESEALRKAPPRAVIHLLGESVAEGRWTAAKKRRIRDSRVLGTANLLAGLRRLPRLPEVLVSASAVGFYGDGGEQELPENGPPGVGFLTDVCKEWESAANQLAADGVRVVNLRIGIVLGRHGGALASMVPLFRWGLGGRLGSGKQWLPWIHLGDLVSLILWCRDHPDLSGPVNAAAPNPVRNAEFTRALAETLHRPAFLPAPAFALKLALGEFAGSLLYSQRVLPRKALESGFQFRFPELRPALADLLV